MIDPLDLMDADKQARAISFLLKTIEDASKRRDGIDKAMKSLDGNPSPETIAKFLRTTMKIVKQQDAAIANLAQVAIIYLGGDSFDRDAGHVAAKMGKGNEALRKMMKKKFGM